ncbi:MAG TPA: sporulation protein YtfJ, partial [Candidatus Ornithomonoglobus intestinigallinarum]|nr:sporulation protein YtfJ [Candidatus Ornithomonoglobus intestinigallinarum]
MDNPVKEMLDGAIKNFETLIDTKKIIGEPIKAADGTVIVPVT